MSTIFKIDSIKQLFTFFNLPEKHPLVGTIDFSKVKGVNFAEGKYVNTFYCIVLKEYDCGSFEYGKSTYDYSQAPLTFMAPNQTISINNNGEESNEAGGIGLFFHPDLLNGTDLADKISKYRFFSYDTNEALHLSDYERQIIKDILEKIDYEVNEGMDQHSQMLIASNIELLLNYSVRFYDRQFNTRKKVNQHILSKFETMSTEYFSSESVKKQGIPSVKFFAENLNLSPNYFSDLLKKETGKSAQDHIHEFLITEAKKRLSTTESSVTEIAYMLGFEYPQYFSKIFKKKTGMTPNQFRKENSVQL
ncbi:helix-turn-helix domain-containing protein [Wenyingzhuangia sp. IMCC45574]